MNREYEGDYDILGKSGVCGVLHVSKEGLYTAFRAKCAYNGNVRRVAVADGENSVTVGVLAPEGEASTLERRYSAAALNAAGLKKIDNAFILGEVNLPMQQNLQEKEEAAANEPQENEPHMGAENESTDTAAAQKEEKPENLIEPENVASENEAAEPDGKLANPIEADNEIAQNAQEKYEPGNVLKVPLNIGGMFSKPEHFFDLKLEDTENGLYGTI